MENFKLVKENIDASPFLNEIEEVDDAWFQNTSRQEKIEVQKEALAIPLRGLRKSKIRDRKRRNVHESRWTTSSRQYPKIREFLENYAEEADAFLGRGKIVCLPAEKRVYPHVDRGEYYQVRDRYHLVLKSDNGSWMRTEGEEVTMKEGELWWFDNNKMHESHNKGSEDRIHIIFDLLPRARLSQVTGV